AEIARLIQAIADGQGSQSITAAIAERERELRNITDRSEEHTSELQSRFDLVCRLLLEKKNAIRRIRRIARARDPPAHAAAAHVDPADGPRVEPAAARAARARPAAEIGAPRARAVGSAV